MSAVTVLRFQVFDGCVNVPECINMAEPCVRKEYRRLTMDEVQAYQAALNAMKNSGEYGEFAIQHRAVISPGAHYGTTTFVWHRVMLIMYVYYTLCYRSVTACRPSSVHAFLDFD